MKVDVVLILGAKLIAIALNFVGLALLSNTMCVGSFGYFVSLYSVSLMISIPVMFGFNFSLVRYTSDKSVDCCIRAKLANDALRQLVMVLFLIWLLGSFVGAIVVKHEFVSYSVFEISTALLFGCAYGLSEVLQSISRNFDGPLYAFVFREVFWRLSFFLVAFFNMQIEGGFSTGSILGFFAINMMLTLFLQIYYSKIRTNYADEPVNECSPTQVNVKQLWHKAPSFMLVGCLATASQHLVVVIAGVALTLEQTAHFFTSLKVMQLLSLSVLAINFVLVPKLRNIKSQCGDSIEFSKISNLCANSAWANMAFCLVGTSIFALFGGHILSLFGPEYEYDRVYLLILCGAAFITAMTGPSGFVMVMFDQQWSFNVLSLLTLALGLGFCFLYGRVYGLVGFCAGYVIWMALQNVGTAILSFRMLKINTTFLGLKNIKDLYL